MTKVAHSSKHHEINGGIPYDIYDDHGTHWWQDQPIATTCMLAEWGEYRKYLSFFPFACPAGHTKYSPNILATHYFFNHLSWITFTEPATSMLALDYNSFFYHDWIGVGLMSDIPSQGHYVYLNTLAFMALSFCSCVILTFSHSPTSPNQFQNQFIRRIPEDTNWKVSTLKDSKGHVTVMNSEQVLDVEWDSIFHYPLYVIQSHGFPNPANRFLASAHDISCSTAIQIKDALQ